MIVKILEFEYPEDRYYLIGHTPTHLWFKSIENKSTYRVGVTDFFQKRIGDIESVTLRKKGDEVDVGKTMSLIKAKNYSAVLKGAFKAKYLDINDNVIKKPNLINMDPYDQGWLYELTIDNLESSLGEKLVQASDTNLKAFLELEIKNNALQGSDCCPDFLGGSGVVRRKKS